jgi:hypothetical protein
VSLATHQHPTLNLEASALKLVELLEERHRIDHHPVPQHALLVGVEHSRRNLMQDELIVADLYGVASVCPALVACDPVGVLGQNVDDLPFTFVTPLRANHNEATDISIEH